MGCFPSKTPVATIGQQMVRLQDAHYKEVKKFSFNGVRVPAKVVHVMDGDTCVLAFISPWTNELIKVRARGLGYNTAEMHPKHPLPQELHATEARDACRALVRFVNLTTDCKIDETTDVRTPSALQRLIDTNTKIIFAEFGEFDDFGRVLTVFYLDTEMSASVNEMMIKEEMAVKYDDNRDKKKLTLLGSSNEQPSPLMLGDSAQPHQLQGPRQKRSLRKD